MSEKSPALCDDRPHCFELEMVRVCDYRCRHCGVWERGPGDGALAFDMWRAALRQIADLAGPGAGLSVTTGEPFLHPRLMDIVSEGRPVSACRRTLILTADILMILPLPESWKAGWPRSGCRLTA